MQSLRNKKVSEEVLNKQWLAILASRKHIGGKFGAGKAVKAQGNAAEEVDWKTRLAKVCQGAWKNSPHFAYETANASATAGPTGPFVSQVSCDSFQSTYEGEPAASKKKAEQSAAQQAFAHEFPAEFQALGQARPAMAWNIGGASGNASKKSIVLAGGNASKKRKIGATTSEALNREEVSSKSRCQAAVMLLLKRPVTKGDVVYDTQALEGDVPTFVSSVRIPAYDPNQAYGGAPCTSKKLAEDSAAEALLNSKLASTFSRLEQDHAVRKAAKNKENVGKMKAKQAADKAVKLESQGHQTHRF